MNTQFPILDSFFKTLTPMLFRRKSHIVDSDNLDRVFYLNQGYVRLYTTSKEGGELTVHIFVPNSVFPIWLDETKELKGYYFESLTPVEVYYCDKAKLQQFISQNPAANLEIIRQLDSFSISTINKLESKVFGSAYQQVVTSILDLARCFSQKDNEEATISYWFTHQDIASITGLSRERVTMEINRLIKENLVSYRNRFITIPKLELLKQELE